MANLTVSGINPYGTYEQSKCAKTTEQGREASKVGELLKNGFKTNLKENLVTSAGVAASLFAADYVAKTGTAQKFITGAVKKIGASKVGKAIINTVKGVAETAAPYAKKAANWFKTLPPAAKGVAIAGAVITAIVATAIRRKGIKNEGKIEQKYADMAALN